MWKGINFELSVGTLNVGSTTGKKKRIRIYDGKQKDGHIFV